MSERGPSPAQKSDAFFCDAKDARTWQRRTPTGSHPGKCGKYHRIPLNLLNSYSFILYIPNIIVSYFRNCGRIDDLHWFPMIFLHFYTLPPPKCFCWHGGLAPSPSRLHQPIHHVPDETCGPSSLKTWRMPRTEMEIRTLHIITSDILRYHQIRWFMISYDHLLYWLIFFMK